METQGNDIKTNHKGNSNLWMYIVLGLLAVVIIGLSVWLISVKNNMKDLITEKEMQRVELQSELDSVILQHDRIKVAYGEISDSLVAMDSIIQANAKEIKEMLNFKWEYYKIKKKLSRLQVVAQGYVRQMDSIVTINHELTEENLQIKEEILIEKRKSRQLEQRTEQLTGIVSEAAVLKVYNLTAMPMHEKGGGKQVETDKIKRTDLVKVCFTLGENTVVEPGNKALYVRIAEPSKEILSMGRGEEYSFMYMGEKLQYSITETVDYQNIAKEVCLNWTRRATKELKPGLYHVEIFQGENIIGHTSFTLK
ncbi:MAG: hypothetical protein Q8O72_01095 [Bacteroidales bacterium]|nr:hypothetical protein [Bacteroidales bacterium]